MMQWQLRWVWSSGLLVAAMLMGASLEAQSQPGGYTTPSGKTSEGRELFQHRCFICHDRDSDRVKALGPTLDGLFKRKTLITGQPVTEENVREVIKTGPTPGMPAFKYSLSEHEIDLLIEFLKTK